MYTMSEMEMRLSCRHSRVLKNHKRIYEQFMSILHLHKRDNFLEKHKLPKRLQTT